MSDTNKVILKPILISSENKKLLQRQNFSSLSVCTEDVIYQSNECDFLKGEPQAVKIVNRLNFVNNTCRTIAKCTSRGVTVETTSDAVCSVIGQKNYDRVLSALCSIFNEETKVRGILALLKPPIPLDSVSTEVAMKRTDLTENSCQTNESYVNLVTQRKRKRLRKPQFTTYVVKENPPLKKCVINIEDIVKKEPELEIKEDPLALPNLDQDPDVSNLSCGSFGSMLSIPSIPDLLDRTDELLISVDKLTEKESTAQEIEIKLLDGSVIKIPKPEDHFHLATQDILKQITDEDIRIKLLKYQAYIDWKMCLQQDDDEYYPLHVAVINDEVALVRRLCFALRRRGESVDLLAGGMTAFHVAIRNNTSPPCITTLLHFGADPLLRDAEGRTGFHLSADAEIDTLTAVLSYCDRHARRLLQNNKDFWKPELESKSDAELAKYLYEKAAEMFDDQGYTPLMVASYSARPEHVSAFVTRAPSKADLAAPCSGETALYRAVAAACLHVKNSSNRSYVPERFLTTVEILVDNGADPSIENHYSSSVNSLLTEFNISPLSMAIANKMKRQTHKQLARTMLYKEKDGTISMKNLNKATENDESDSKVSTAKVVQDMTVIKPEPKRIVKNFTIVAPKVFKANDNLKVVKKGLCLQAIKPGKTVLLKDNYKIKQDGDRVIIVENVKLNTDILQKATTSNVIAKNLVLTNPAERIVTVNNRTKLKIASKLISSDIEQIINKKRKFNEK